MKQSTTDLFKGLLFLEGHVFRPEDLRTGARAATGDDPGSAPGGQAAPPRSTPGFLQTLLLLGGRPMHGGHNLDLDEPFELPGAPAAGAARCAGASCG